MKRIILFFTAVVIVAALSSYLTLRLVDHSSPLKQTEFAHRWLHEELHITPAQHSALAPIEEHFARQQKRYSTNLLEANRHLARIMSADKVYTPRVAAAVEQVHRCMGDLQKASIEHVFEMHTVLTPSQGEQLLDLARKSLEQPP
tara:strand:- start:196 stop:630 length:435 start_codon:yes stop_codon:yes gene_type:complete